MVKVPSAQFTFLSEKSHFHNKSLSAVIIGTHQFLS